MASVPGSGTDGGGGCCAVSKAYSAVDMHARWRLRRDHAGRAINFNDLVVIRSDQRKPFRKHWATRQELFRNPGSTLEGRLSIEVSVCL